MADRVDAGVSDGTHTPFTDSDKPPTAVLISNARQMFVCGVVMEQDHVRDTLTRSMQWLSLCTRRGA